MDQLTGFHAHIYFDATAREQAVDLRKRIGCRFPVELGRLHDRPVGPHTRAMFQVLFSREEFGSLVPWLMCNRGDLPVLIHAETGNDLRDHTEFTFWLGEPLTLNLDVLTPRVHTSARGLSA